MITPPPIFFRVPVCHGKTRYLVILSIFLAKLFRKYAANCLQLLIGPAESRGEKDGFPLVDDSVIMWILNSIGKSLSQRTI